MLPSILKMRKILTTILLASFLSAFVQAQAPANYYDSAIGLSGTALKDSLHEIIDDHTSFPYTGSSTDVWDILKLSNQDPANSDNVILIYSGNSVDANQEYNSGSGWNREHLWAKSRGDFGTTTVAGSDIHNLVPSDISVNSARNNRWFDECAIPYYDEGAFTGSYTCGSSLWAWEPREDVKGDIARSLFYMATRYEGENGNPNLELIDSIPSNNNTALPIHARLSTLIDWHLSDPVDAFEQNRNEVIYSFQGNRNPFVDEPSFVCQIWEAECLVLPLDLVSFNLDYKKQDNQVALYWRTLNQLNSSHFELEHSLDAKQWKTIARIDALDSKEEVNYSFFDREAVSGDNYYRLKMLDFDLSFDYSDILVASLNFEEVHTLKVFPNPVTDNCLISFSSEEGLHTVITVFDNIGRRIISKNLLSEGNKTMYSLNTQNLPKGVYFIQINGLAQVEFARIVKQ